MPPILKFPRTCTGCTACCQAPAIPSLHKPAGQPCQYLAQSACSVYHQRQDPRFAHCVSFSCLWLQGEHDTDDRPDRTGAVFFAKPDPDLPSQFRIYVAETYPGAADQPRTLELIRQYLAQGLTVAITNPIFAIAIRPGGHSWRYTIDPQDPLRSQIDPTTPPLQLTSHGRPLIKKGTPMTNLQ